MWWTRIYWEYNLREPIHLSGPEHMVLSMFVNVWFTALNVAR
jgi:hypothetical protein